MLIVQTLNMYVQQRYFIRKHVCTGFGHVCGTWVQNVSDVGDDSQWEHPSHWSRGGQRCRCEKMQSFSSSDQAHVLSFHAGEQPRGPGSIPTLLVYTAAIIFLLFFVSGVVGCDLPGRFERNHTHIVHNAGLSVGTSSNISQGCSTRCAHVRPHSV